MLEDFHEIEIQEFEEQSDDNMAIVESENFAINSNIEFLYLIGKYAA